MDKRKVAVELIKTAQTILGAFENYTLSDEDKTVYDREKDWFIREMNRRGFDYDTSFTPQWSKDAEGSRGVFSIDVSGIQYPDSSLTAHNPWFKVVVMETEGRGRGGRLLGHMEYKVKKASRLHSMLESALKEVDTLIKRDTGGIQKMITKFEKAIEQYEKVGVLHFKGDAAMVQVYHDDAASLRIGLELIKKGQYKEAARYLGARDTVVREQVPEDLWDFIHQM